MNLKVRHKVGGGMSIDGQVPDQLTFNPDGSIGTAHTPNLTTATDDTLVPWGLVKGLRSLPLFFRDIHFGTRESIPTVFNGTARPNDGDEVYAETHPQVVLGILSGAQVSCTEAEWQTDPYKRGMWSRGTAALVDGRPTGWVRMPDMNQAKAGSLPPPFVRGGDDTKVGGVGKDTMRKIEGDSAAALFSAISAGQTGPFKTGRATNTPLLQTGAANVTTQAFDSSLAIPAGHTGTEFAPWHLYGVSYSIIANGVMNEANINAAGLSAMLDVAYAKIATLAAQPKMPKGVTTTVTRVAGVQYTNDSTTDWMLVTVVLSSTATNGYGSITVSDTRIAQTILPLQGWAGYIDILVGPLQTYNIVLSNATISQVKETR